MKIVFCGPAHSGKSVFIANLSEKLPTDAHSIIRACPDGEGTWSNNRNQKEIRLVRKKGNFTDDFVNETCRAIDSQSDEIVIVDVGGIMSKQNGEIFKHCDNFVVLSNNEKSKKEWIEFGEKQGLDCIGALDSSMEGHEEIYSRVPYLQGKVVGLERGKVLKNSQILDVLSSDIVRKSKYNQNDSLNEEKIDDNVIDDTKFGFELGYGKEIETEDGIPIKKVKWKEDAISKIYKTIPKKIGKNREVNIKGVRANFILATIAKVCKNNGVENVNAFDIRSNTYIPIKNLPKKKGQKQSESLLYNIIESKNNIFMDIDIAKQQYPMEDYEKCVLPQIDEKKNLFISGRIPLWLLASISNSYDSSKIFTFQPGKGFTCVSSENEKDLGLLVDGIDEIDINQYFEDKKEKSIANVQNKGLFEKFRQFFTNIQKNQKNSKYINKSIVANDITPRNNDGLSDFERKIRYVPTGIVEPNLVQTDKSNEKSLEENSL